MPIAISNLRQIRSRLRTLYGERAEDALQQLVSSIEQTRPTTATKSLELDPRELEKWDQRDIVLITYGDQVQSAKLTPLQTLQRFLLDWDLTESVNTIHILPCFPYTSDDGFSVVDYRTIDPDLGTWDDVHALRKDFKLMLDFVVNHISQESEWFQSYLAGHSPFDQFFIEASPKEDLSQVTRPRSLPLLSDFETSRGRRWLWTTFSRDQVDLNYAEPAVLAEIVSILLEYIEHGASIIRLDAIAYLWKKIGTPCIHLPETHEVVKLLREVLDELAPHVTLLTETNVPHEENISYFGNGDEAHMVYQFSLPPLLLDAFLNEDAEPLKSWLKTLASPPEKATFFNFTASHDGIGVRPLEGRVNEARLGQLVEKVRKRGGLIGTRRQPDGSDSPYELNISYVDALAPVRGSVESHAKRFLASQAVMLALQGVPAVYFHSLVGSQNDLDGVAASGIPRRINRKKFQLEFLNEQIQRRNSLQNLIFTGMQRMLKRRVAQPAFHPAAEQHYVESHSSNVLAFERHCPDSGQRILAAVNFGDDTEAITLPKQYTTAVDLLSDERHTGNRVHLTPAQVVWLEGK